MVQGYEHNPGLSSGFVPDTGLSLSSLVTSLKAWKHDCLCFCLSAVCEKQTSAARSTLEALVEEEGCTLEKQMFKGAIAAALRRVTQLSGHGFANINAV